MSQVFFRNSDQNDKSGEKRIRKNNRHQDLDSRKRHLPSLN
ncbi:hypothetical protein SynNOUM97013_02464 [Synechococcus sp. NOUM97013]|nr:hypothetical protein SynNOUM97013_02464 [Synechococcus sp. NOUM97013]